MNAVWHLNKMSSGGCRKADVVMQPWDRGVQAVSTSLGESLAAISIQIKNAVTHWPNSSISRNLPYPYSCQSVKR